MNKIENVQRRFTKHVKGMHKFSYEDRLKKLKLPSIEFRQIRGDMLQVFKIAKSLFKFNSDNRLRGHNYKINKQVTNKSKFQNFFFKQSSV